MNEAKHLRIFLDGHLRRRVAQGRHNFLGHVTGAFESIGWKVEICPDDDAQLLRARTQPGYSMVNMLHPVSDRGLTFRLAYVYPFWKIERTGTRWEFETARKAFRPDAIDPDISRQFANSARNRLFPEWKGIEPRRDYIYVPLQGQLLQRRAHQSMSPIDMVRETLDLYRDTRTVITMHPRETYSPEEISTLNQMVSNYPNAELATKSPNQLIPFAKMIVTQNSSIAFFGLFLKKPAVLFAKADFHHIASNVDELGVSAAFGADAPTDSMIEKYLFWFLQQNAINAGRDTVRANILKRAATLGWPTEAR